MKLTQDLVPKTEDVKAEEIGDMVESEMQMTSKAIEQAAKKIEVIEEFMSFFLMFCIIKKLSFSYACN